MLERNVFVVPPEKSENDLDEILSKIGNLIYFSENLNPRISGASQLSDFSSDIKAFRKDGKCCIEFKNADILFTSGTSGKSKAVAISPESATFTAKNLVSILRMNLSQTELQQCLFALFGLIT